MLALNGRCENFQRQQTTCMTKEISQGTVETL